MNQVKTGKFIATLRKKKGLTQEDLAEKMAVSNKAVSKWETGRSFPDADKIPALCELLGISINDFYNGEIVPDDIYQSKAEQSIITIQKNMEMNNKKSEQKMAIVLVVSALIIALLVMMNIHSIEQYKKYTLPGIIQGTFLLGDELLNPEYIVVDQNMSISKYHQFGQITQGNISSVSNNYYYVEFDNDCFYIVYHTDYVEILYKDSLLEAVKISSVPTYINISH